MFYKTDFIAYLCGQNEKAVSVSRFFLYYTVYGGIIAGIALLLSRLVNAVQVLSANFWLIFAYLFVLTGIAYVLSHFGIRKSPQAGVLAILGGLVLKFFFALSFFVVLILKSSENQMVLGLNFFSVYLLLTVFEVSYLLRILRHQN